MTVTTFYPNAGTTSPIDGNCNNDLSSSTWAAVHDAASGTDSATSDPTIRSGAEKISAGRWIVTRMVTNFDTAVIGSSATISAAEWGGKMSDATTNVVVDTVNIVAHTITNTTLATGDFDVATFWTDSTSYGSIAISTITTVGTFYPITLSSFTIINKTGLTKMGTRFGKDIDNVDPASGRSYWGIESADTAGTTSDPYLTVTYSVPVTSIPDARVFFM